MFPLPPLPLPELLLPTTELLPPSAACPEVTDWLPIIVGLVCISLVLATPPHLCHPLWSPRVPAPPPWGCQRAPAEALEASGIPEVLHQQLQKGPAGVSQPPRLSQKLFQQPGVGHHGIHQNVILPCYSFSRFWLPLLKIPLATWQRPFQQLISRLCEVTDCAMSGSQMLSRLLLPAREGGGIQTTPTCSYHRAVQKKNPAASLLSENIVQVVPHLNKQPGREWEQPGYSKRGKPAP